MVVYAHGDWSETFEGTPEAVKLDYWAQVAGQARLSKVSNAPIHMSPSAQEPLLYF